MATSQENLIGLPVYTESNQHLGQVSGIETDNNTGKVSKYQVENTGLIKNLIKGPKLLIDQSQVIKITEEKMIVEDGLIPETTPQVEPASA